MIKNLSEKRKIPRIGKIHLGVKTEGKNNKSSYPTAVDYFVVKEEKNTPAAAVDAFKKVYGDKPKEIDIMFPNEDIDSIFPQALKMYKQSGLYCIGDGEKARRAGDDGILADCNCDPEKCQFKSKNQCKEIGNLKVILPRVAGLGIWQIDTSSYHSIVSINSAIDFLKQQFGRISGIPLKLTLVPQEVKGGGVKKTVFVLSIKSDESLEKIKLHPMRQMHIAENDINEREEDQFPNEVVSGTGCEKGGEDINYPVEEEDEDDPFAANGDNDLSVEKYEVTSKGDIKGRPAVKLKPESGGDELVALVKCDASFIKAGLRIIPEMSMQGKYMVIEKYKVA